MKVRFLSKASLELDEAISYYDKKSLGLGYRFYLDVSNTIKRIKFMPNAWTQIGKKTRRCLLKFFPYSIHYINEKDEIVITAIANLNRKPEHYKDRII